MQEPPQLKRMKNLITVLIAILSVIWFINDRSPEAGIGLLAIFGGYIAWLWRDQTRTTYARSDQIHEITAKDRATYWNRYVFIISKMSSKIPYTKRSSTTLKSNINRATFRIS
jgi:hypothetical protein